MEHKIKKYKLIHGGSDKWKLLNYKKNTNNKTWSFFVIQNIFNKQKFNAKLFILSPISNIINHICLTKYNYYYGLVVINPNNIQDGGMDAAVESANSVPLFTELSQEEIQQKLLLTRENPIICNLLESIKNSKIIKKNFENIISNDYFYYYILCKFYIENHSKNKNNKDFFEYLQINKRRLIAHSIINFSEYIKEVQKLQQEFVELQNIDTLIQCSKFIRTSTKMLPEIVPKIVPKINGKSSLSGLQPSASGYNFILIPSIETIPLYEDIVSLNTKLNYKMKLYRNFKLEIIYVGSSQFKNIIDIGLEMEKYAADELEKYIKSASFILELDKIKNDAISKEELEEKVKSDFLLKKKEEFRITFIVPLLTEMEQAVHLYFKEVLKIEDADKILIWSRVHPHEKILKFFGQYIPDNFINYPSVWDYSTGYPLSDIFEFARLHILGTYTYPHIVTQPFCKSEYLIEHDVRLDDARPSYEQLDDTILDEKEQVIEQYDPNIYDNDYITKLNEIANDENDKLNEYGTHFINISRKEIIFLIKQIRWTGTTYNYGHSYKIYGESGSEKWVLYCMVRNIEERLNELINQGIEIIKNILLVDITYKLFLHRIIPSQTKVEYPNDYEQQYRLQQNVDIKVKYIPKIFDERMKIIYRGALIKKNRSEENSPYISMPQILFNGINEYSDDIEVKFKKTYSQDIIENNVYNFNRLFLINSINGDSQIINSTKFNLNKDKIHYNSIKDDTSNFYCQMIFLIATRNNIYMKSPLQSGYTMEQILHSDDAMNDFLKNHFTRCFKKRKFIWLVGFPTQSWRDNKSEVINIFDLRDSDLSHLQRLKEQIENGLIIFFLRLGFRIFKKNITIYVNMPTLEPYLHFQIKIYLNERFKLMLENEIYDINRFIHTFKIFELLQLKCNFFAQYNFEIKIPEFIEKLITNYSRIQ